MLEKNIDRVTTEAADVVLDFLMEQSMILNNYHSRLYVFNNICKFILKWYQLQGELPSGDKLFNSLITVLKNFEHVDPGMFFEMLKTLSESPDILESKEANIIDLINILPKNEKRVKHMELTREFLAVVLQCHKQSSLTFLKQPLIELLHSLLMQSKSFWVTCLDYEDNYRIISSIKDKLAIKESFIAYHIKDTPSLEHLYRRTCQVLDNIYNKEQQKATKAISSAEKDKASNEGSLLMPVPSSVSITDSNLTSPIHQAMTPLIKRRPLVHSLSLQPYSPINLNPSPIITPALPQSIEQSMIAPPADYKKMLVPYILLDMQTALHESIRQKGIERILQAEKAKRFMLTFSDEMVDSAQNLRGETYLLSIASSLSLDMCSRKLLTEYIPKSKLKVKQATLGLIDLFTQAEVPLSSRKAMINSELLVKTISTPESRKHKESETYEKLATSDSPLLPTPEPSTPGLTKAISINSRGQKQFLTEGKDNESSPKQMQSIKLRSINPRQASLEEIMEYLPAFFGVNDRFIMAVNTGLIQGDNNYPVDCVLFIGERGLYFKTHYTILYESNNKRLVNLEGNDHLKSSLLGKWYLTLEEMSQPYAPCGLIDNKYRKQKSINVAFIYEIIYSSLAEIHVKNFIGRTPLCLEFWTKGRIPRLFVFNQNQIQESWQLIIDRWAHSANLEHDQSEVKKLFSQPIKSIYFFCKTEDEQQKPVLSIIDSLTLASKLKTDWTLGNVDNFNYLMALNAASGRSVCFLANYFVFPQTVQNYERLEYLNETAARNLALPIGIACADPNKVREIAANCKDPTKEENFNYGTMYSNKNSYGHYLFRLMPATQYMMEVNSDHVDNRSFVGLQKDFKLATTQSYSEIIPEMYYMSHYLVNSNNLVYSASSNRDIGDVLMPEFCHGNPRYLTMKMRQMLESGYANKHLGAWIDLIFGYAQNGMESMKRVNVFSLDHYKQANDILRGAKLKSEQVNVRRKISFQEEMDGKFIFQLQCGLIPMQIFFESHNEKLPQDPSTKNCLLLSILTQKDQTGTMSSWIYKPLAEAVPDVYKTLIFTRLNLLEDNQWSYGPISTLMKRTKQAREMSSMRPSLNDQKEPIAVLSHNSFAVSKAMIGVVSKTGEVLLITRSQMSMFKVQTPEITAFEYDSNNSTLWMGNICGEVFGISFGFSQSDVKKEVLKIISSTAIMDQQIRYTYRSAQKLDIINLTEITDASLFRKLLKPFFNYRALLQPKLVFSHFMMMYYTTKLNINFETGTFETKDALSSATIWNKLFSGEGKVKSVKVSPLSNLLFAIHSPLSVVVWDIYERKVIARIHPPHFSQPSLLLLNQEKVDLYLKKFFLKSVASLQKIMAFTFSQKNEDLCVVTEDYISVYTSSGVLLANERRSNDHHPYTSATFLDVNFAYLV